MINKIIYSVLAMLLSLTGFFTAIFFSQIPIAVVLGAAFAVCLLWFADVVRQIDAREKRRARRAMREPVEEYRRIDFADDLKDDEPEDKPKEVKTGIVRPGSRPSISYINMRAIEEGREIINDVRREA